LSFVSSSPFLFTPDHICGALTGLDVYLLHGPLVSPCELSPRECSLFPSSFGEPFLSFLQPFHPSSPFFCILSGRLAPSLFAGIPTFQSCIFPLSKCLPANRSLSYPLTGFPNMFRFCCRAPALRISALRFFSTLR